jgi:SAM-dependent methyltransferase
VNYQTIPELVADLEAHPVEKRGSIYHPIPFPEFGHLKTSSDRAEVQAKWTMIERALLDCFPSGLAGKRILDIGANAGFYTFSLAQKGAEVTAFESHPRYGPIGRFLAAEKKLNVRWRDSAFDAGTIEGERFDAALMLSVFQWMAEGGNNWTAAAASVRAVSEISDCLIFELGYNRGESCLRTTRWNHYAELVRMLRETTAYQHFKLLGQARIWRGAPRFLILCSHRREFEDSLARRVIRAIKI